MHCPFCSKCKPFVLESRVVLDLTCTIGGFQLSLPLVVRSVRGAVPKTSLQQAGPGADALDSMRSVPSGPEMSPALQQLRDELSPDTLTSLGESGEPVDAAFLQRWLTARKNSLSAARADIEAHAHWRRSFLGPTGVQEGEVASDLAAGRAFFQGLSRDGCPVLILRAARFAEAGGGAAAAQRLICFLMDRAAPLADTEVNPLSQFRVIFDLSGLSTRGLESLYQALVGVFEVLQRHYPERLRSLYFVRSPMLFWGVWRLLASFVDPVTREKIQFIGYGEAGRQALLREVPEQVLPDAYGGSAPFIPVLEGLSLFAVPLPSPTPLPSPAVSAGAASRQGPMHGLATAVTRLPGISWVRRTWAARRRDAGSRALAPPSPHLHVHHHYHHHRPAHQLARDTWRRAGALSRSMHQLLRATPGKGMQSWLLPGHRSSRAGTGVAAAVQWALAVLVVLVLMRLAMLCATVLAPQLTDWRAAVARLV